jgi:hypothetical protein
MAKGSTERMLDKAAIRAAKAKSFVGGMFRLQ